VRALYKSASGTDRLAGGLARADRIDAPGAGAEGHDLQQAAGHRDVLQQVDHLVLVAHVAVEGKGRNDREQREGGGDMAGLEAGHQQQAATEFHRDGDGKGERREGQAAGGDVADGAGRRFQTPVLSANGRVHLILF